MRVFFILWVGAVLSLALITGSCRNPAGSNYPYKGKLMDNSGHVVNPPTYGVLTNESANLH
jgi:hypothetical protein